MIEQLQLSATNLRLTMQRLANYERRLIIVATVMCLMTSLVAAEDRKPNILIIFNIVATWLSD